MSASSTDQQASACLQPPKGVALSTLSDAQLRSYALPSRPHDAAELSNWTALLAHSKHRVCATEPDPYPIQVDSSIQPLYASQETSQVWAGVVATGYGYQRVVGTWKAPNLWTSTATTSFWVGLGGDENDGAGWLVQVGIQGNDCQTCRVAMQYSGLAEDFLNPNQKYQIAIPSSQLTINALDSVEAIADSNYSFPAQVYFYIGDITTNTSWGNAYSYPTANGSTAEWIVETDGKLDQFQTRAALLVLGSTAPPPRMTTSSGMGAWCT